MQQEFIKFKRLKVIRISVILLIVLLIGLRRMRGGGSEAHSKESAGSNAVECRGLETAVRAVPDLRCS